MEDRLHLVGGWNPNEYSDPPTVSEHWYSDDDGLTWDQLPDAPWEARHSAGWLMHNGKFFVIGGDASSGHYQTDIWSYDPDNGWVLKAATVPWGKRVLHQVASNAGKIYVIAGQTIDDAPVDDPVGMTPKHYTDVWSSSNEGVTWTRDSLDIGIGPMAAIIGVPYANGKFHLVGGGRYVTEGQPNLFFNTVWSSTDLLNWTLSSYLPTGSVRYNVVLAFKDHIVSLGGVDDTGTNTQTVIASKNGVAWRDCGPGPWAARHASSACVHKGEIILMCGPLTDTAIWAFS